MRFCTIIDNEEYIVHGELEGDHENPELIIESVEFEGVYKKPQDLEGFYKVNKDIIDQDAIDQSVWENDNNFMEMHLNYG